MVFICNKYGGEKFMKFTKVAALLLSLGMVGTGVAACSNEPEPVSSDINIISTQGQNSGVAASEATVNPNAQNENYAFNYKGYDFIVDTVMDESKLPENYDVDETASCAGVGLATIYRTGSFDVELRVGSDIIAAIYIHDDTVTTAEGIYIGNTMDQVKQVYGEPSMDNGHTIEYFKGSSKLHFEFKDTGAVETITYFSQQ